MNKSWLSSVEFVRPVLWVAGKPTVRNISSVSAYRQVIQTPKISHQLFQFSANTTINSSINLKLRKKTTSTKPKPNQSTMMTLSNKIISNIHTKRIKPRISSILADQSIKPWDSISANKIPQVFLKSIKPKIMKTLKTKPKTTKIPFLPYKQFLSWPRKSSAHYHLTQPLLL